MPGADLWPRRRSGVPEAVEEVCRQHCFDPELLGMLTYFGNMAKFKCREYFLVIGFHVVTLLISLELMKCVLLNLEKFSSYLVALTLQLDFGIEDI